MVIFLCLCLGQMSCVVFTGVKNDFYEQGVGSSFFFCVLAGVPVRVFLLCFPSADAGSPVFLYFPKKIRLPAASLHCLHHIALPSCLSSLLFSPFSPSPSSSPSLSLPSSRRRPPQITQQNFPWHQPETCFRYGVLVTLPAGKGLCLDGFWVRITPLRPHIIYVPH